MTTRQAPIDLGPGITPREAATDALLRSAFLPTGVFDLSGLKAATGVEIPPTVGPDAMIATILAHAGPMVTSHAVTNVRVKLNDAVDRAELSCYVTAQHFRPGEGYDASKAYVLSGNTHWADVVKCEGGTVEDGESGGSGVMDAGGCDRH